MKQDKEKDKKTIYNIHIEMSTDEAIDMVMQIIRNFFESSRYNDVCFPLRQYANTCAVGRVLEELLQTRNSNDPRLTELTSLLNCKPNTD